MFTPDQDRRRAARHQLILDIFFDGDESVGIAQTRDINVHGLYFNTLASIPKGSVLKLRLPLSQTREYLILDAEVVYSQPGVGCAVEFTGMTDESTVVLAQFIAESKESRTNNWEYAEI